MKIHTEGLVAYAVVTLAVTALTWLAVSAIFTAALAERPLQFRVSRQEVRDERHRNSRLDSGECDGDQRRCARAFDSNVARQEWDSAHYGRHGSARLHSYCGGGHSQRVAAFGEDPCGLTHVSRQISCNYRAKYDNQR